ncbi:uncharacterized protein [Ptychodera flava]|uniref:uncharacterized protein n=1 Tax=Ptychodera flava TaxID=63121 RepID=UPI00396A95D1
MADDPATSVKRSRLSIDVDAGSDDEDQKRKVFYQPLSLLDTAAKATSLYYCCDELESQNLAFDDALWKKIAFWAFPRDESEIKLYFKLVNTDEQAWTMAAKFVEREKLTDVIQVGFMVTASVSDGRPYQVSLTFERCKIVSSTCSGCVKQLWCSHILAAVIYRIRFSHKVVIHAPMTESLSALSREQLQKLLQYHVAEDPGLVLGKLFKHFDDVRDVQSDINQTDALPDPTIGLAEGISNTWQRSIEILERKTISELKKASILHDNRLCYHGPGHTPSNCERSTLYQHVKRIRELMARRDGKARQVLMVIAKATVKVMRENQQERYEAPDLDRFCHEIERLMRACVLNPACMSIPVLKQMQAFLLKLYRESAGLKSNVVRHSQWVELPSVVPVLKNKDYIVSVLLGEPPLGIDSDVTFSSDQDTEEDIGNWELLMPGNQGADGGGGNIHNDGSNLQQSGHLFKEALCLSTLRIHNRRLRIGGSDCKLMSFSVTLAILETLLLHGYHRSATKLAVKQLTVLLTSVQRDSILSQQLPAYRDVELTDNQPSTSKGGKISGKSTRSRTKAMKEEDADPTSKGKGKGSGVKGKGKSKGKGKAIKEKEEKPPSPSKVKMHSGANKIAQLNFALLHLCEEVFKSSHASEEDKTLAFKAGLHALELSQFRYATSKMIKETEQEFLEKMEEKMMRTMKNLNNKLHPMEYIETYVEALTRATSVHYAYGPPLKLLKFLSSLWAIHHQLRMKLIIMCKHVLGLSNDPLQQVSKRSMLGTACEIFVSILASFEDMVVAKKQLHHLAEVQESICNFQDPDLIHSIFKVLKERAELDSQIDMIAVVRVGIAGIKCFKHVSPSSRRFYYTSSFHHQNDVFHLAAKLGVEGVPLFLGSWQDYLKPAEIMDYLRKLKNAMGQDEWAALPDIIVELLTEYLSLSPMLTDSNIEDMMIVFDLENRKLSVVPNIILANASKYEANSLFRLARHYFKRGRHPSGSSQKLIEAAFENLNNSVLLGREESIMHYVKWAFTSCTATQINILLSKVKDFKRCYSSVAQVYGKNLSRFWGSRKQDFEKFQDVLRERNGQVKFQQPFSEIILAGYKGFFSGWLSRIETTTNVYQDFVEALQVSISKCAEVSKEVFRREVMRPIREADECTRKPKLCSLMDRTFPEIKQEN